MNEGAVRCRTLISYSAYAVQCLSGIGPKLPTVNAHTAGTSLGPLSRHESSTMPLSGGWEGGEAELMPAFLQSANSLTASVIPRRASPFALQVPIDRRHIAQQA